MKPRWMAVAVLILAAVAPLDAADSPRRTENAVLGPDTPALGERKNAPRVRQSQIAAPPLADAMRR